MGEGRTEAKGEGERENGQGGGGGGGGGTGAGGGRTQREEKRKEREKGGRVRRGGKKGEKIEGGTRMTTGDPRVAVATKGSRPQTAHGVPVRPNDQNIPWGVGCRGGSSPPGRPAQVPLTTERKGNLNDEGARPSPRSD